MTEQHSVILLMFDLPAVTGAEKKAYRRFRKTLLASGYSAMQESVYVKLLRSSRTVPSELAALDKIAPGDCKLHALPLSLAQFKRMTAVRGVPFDFALFSDDVFVINA